MLLTLLDGVRLPWSLVCLLVALSSARGGPGKSGCRAAFPCLCRLCSRCEAQTGPSGAVWSVPPTAGGPRCPPLPPAPVATTAHGGLSRRRREGRGGPEPWHLAPAQWGPPSVSHLGPRYRTGEAGGSAAETQVWVKYQRLADPVQAEAELQRWRAHVRRAGASGPLQALQSPPGAWGSRHLEFPKGSLWLPCSAGGGHPS